MKMRKLFKIIKIIMFYKLFIKIPPAIWRRWSRGWLLVVSKCAKLLACKIECRIAFFWCLNPLPQTPSPGAKSIGADPSGKAQKTTLVVHFCFFPPIKLRFRVLTFSIGLVAVGARNPVPWLLAPALARGTEEPLSFAKLS